MDPVDHGTRRNWLLTHGIDYWRNAMQWITTLGRGRSPRPIPAPTTASESSRLASRICAKLMRIRLPGVLAGSTRDRRLDNGGRCASVLHDHRSVSSDRPHGTQGKYSACMRRARPPPFAHDRRSKAEAGTRVHPRPGIARPTRKAACELGLATRFAAIRPRRDAGLPPSLGQPQRRRSNTKHCEPRQRDAKAMAPIVA